jgi:hypothetical protein
MFVIQMNDEALAIFSRFDPVALSTIMKMKVLQSPMFLAQLHAPRLLLLAPLNHVQ